MQDDGYVVLNQLIDAVSLSQITDLCDGEVTRKVGTRNLLKKQWIVDLGRKIKAHPLVEEVLPNKARLVQCNYFYKDELSNWSVTLHRDLSIPIKARIESERWSGWSEKEGVLYVQPPKNVLESLIAVRLHLEDNNSENGALELVPGSHNKEVNRNNRILVEVDKGGVLLMRPLILHASTKVKSGSRRVLHFIYGPERLPDGAEWNRVSINKQ